MQWRIQSKLGSQDAAVLATEYLIPVFVEDREPTEKGLTLARTLVQDESADSFLNLLRENAWHPTAAEVLPLFEALL